MIKNPNRIVNQGILSGLLNPKDQIQQNWIDLTIKSIAALGPNLEQEDEWVGNSLGHAERSHIDRVILEPDQDGWIYLDRGQYEIIYNETFKLPNGLGMDIRTRSTVNRGGNFITSWFYDAGFAGLGGGMLHVFQPLRIQLNVRIAQAIFFEAEEWSLYDGVYNTTTSL